MPDITITHATIGGARIAITNNGIRDNFASTLFISYADSTQLEIITPDYDMVATLEGFPLSISLFSDPDIDPSSSINQIAMFYALDIIEDSSPEDDALDPSFEGNIPTSPSDNTFTWNGNRLTCSKKSEKRYINVVDSGEIGNATQQVMLMGVPMAQGLQNELILNKTAYSTSDIDEYKTFHIGGSPLTVGRIENSYYLIISPVLSADT